MMFKKQELPGAQNIKEFHNIYIKKDSCKTLIRSKIGFRQEWTPPGPSHERTS